MVDKLPSKEKDFSDWYVETILRAQLADYAPIQGCIVFMPNSYEIWEKIQDAFNEKIRKTGHRNCYFPMFLPEKLLHKEAEHFDGFIPEVAWVTKGGNSKLAEPLAIRPTSETIFGHMYSKWVRSHRDLPILFNQWCSVVRWETKAVKPFLRTREFLWQEGHTVHATLEEAEKETLDRLEDYKRVVEDYLAIPILAGKKSEGEKFAGAVSTYAIEAIMPDGKALQMATSHNFGQNFSKAYDIKFLDENEKEKYAFQSSWGMSTRVIGAMVMVHGDDKGLVVPPKLAPLQVVIVPIPYKGKEKQIANKAHEISKKITASVHVDDRAGYTPGWKFNEWELRGVPIRLELGPKDMEKKQVVLVRRDTGDKKPVKWDKIDGEIKKTLDDIQASLFKKAKKFLDSNIITVKDYSEFKKVFKGKPKFIKADWCNDLKCEEKICNETGAIIRLLTKEKPKGKCMACGKPAKAVAIFGRAY